MFKASEINKALRVNPYTLRTWVNRNNLMLTNSPNRAVTDEAMKEVQRRGYSFSDAVRIHYLFKRCVVRGINLNEIIPELNAAFDYIEKAVADWSAALEETGRTDRRAGPWLMFGAQTMTVAPAVVVFETAEELMQAIAGSEEDARRVKNRLTGEDLVDLRELTRETAVLLGIVAQKD